MDNFNLEILFLYNAIVKLVRARLKAFEILL